jgi:hypothetical protein
MKAIKWIVIILIAAAAVAGITRAVWTISNGVDDAKDFVNSFFGKSDDTSGDEPQDSYSNVDGLVNQTKVLNDSGVKTITVDAGKSVVKLRVGGSKVVVQAQYDEGNFTTGNKFVAEQNGTTITISMRQRLVKSQKSTLTVTIPESFRGLLVLELDAGTLDGEIGKESVEINANAAELELRGIRSSVAANINAGAGKLVVEDAGGDISVKGNACALTAVLPYESNYTVSSNGTLLTVKDNYSSSHKQKGKAYGVNLRGAAAAYTIDVSGG